MAYLNEEGLKIVLDNIKDYVDGKKVSIEELTDNDVSLLLDVYFSSGGGYGSGSASATGLDEVINSTGVGDYDEESTISE